MSNIPYIVTKDGLQCFIDGTPHSFSISNPLYSRILSAVRNGGTKEELEEILEGPGRRVKVALNGISDSGEVAYNHGIVTYKGAQLHGFVIDRLVEEADKGNSITPILNFIARVQKNPSKNVVDNLFEFIEYGKLPLTPNGCFLAYKAVRDNFYDIHSGKFYNGIGAVCEVPRNTVVEDRNITCAPGLHVCSFKYLPHFRHANGHVVVCQVDPADVVAIPADYNNTKMRVSKYLVINEVHNYYTEQKDVLADTGVLDEEYRIWEREYSEDDWESDPGMDIFHDYEDALADAKERLAGALGNLQVRVTGPNDNVMFKGEVQET